MKKRFVAIMLCISLAAGILAGCGGRGTVEDISPEPDRRPAGEQSVETDTEIGGETDRDTNAGTGGETGGGTGGETGGGASAEIGQETPDGGKDSSGVYLLHPCESNYSLTGYGTNSTYRMLMEERCGAVGLNSAEAAEWPKLAAALREAGEVEKATAESEFADYFRDAEDFFSEMEMDDTGYFVCETEPHVVRADTVMLSVRKDYGDYLGGAHGYHGIYGDNYDTASGEKLAIENVVKDMDRLQEILFEQLMALPDAEDWLDEESLKKTMAEYPGEELYTWLMDYDGVTLFFNPYSIAPYAAGIIQVKLPFDAYPELFVEKYTKVPDAYTELMMTYAPVYADLNGDGKKEEISYYYEYNYDYDGIEALVVNTGGKTTSVDIYCYAADVYLVHVGDRNYLYAFFSSDNDFRGIKVYELSENGAREMQDGMGGGCAQIFYSDGYRDEAERIYSVEVTCTTFTDPNRFGLISQMYPLGALFGYGQYHVGQDGFPERDTAYFDLTGDWKKEWINAESKAKTFTALQEMEMRGLREDFSESGETVTISAGAELAMLRTDCASYVDFLTADGRLVRASMTAEEYPYTLCGIPMEEALDGIFYAG